MTEPNPPTRQQIEDAIVANVPSFVDDEDIEATTDAVLALLVSTPRPEPTVDCENCAFRYGAEHVDEDETPESACPVCLVAAIEGQVALVYDHVTGGRISKANTMAFEVIAEHDDLRTKEIDEAVAEAAADRVSTPQPEPAALNALREDCYVKSVDVCGHCGDSECDGIGCIAALNPDDDDDFAAIEALHEQLRDGEAWQTLERIINAGESVETAYGLAAEALAYAEGRITAWDRSGGAAAEEAPPEPAAWAIGDPVQFHIRYDGEYVGWIDRFEQGRVWVRRPSWTISSVPEWEAPPDSLRPWTPPAAAPPEPARPEWVEIVAKSPFVAGGYLCGDVVKVEGWTDGGSPRLRYGPRWNRQQTDGGMFAAMSSVWVPASPPSPDPLEAFDAFLATPAPVAAPVDEPEPEPFVGRCVHGVMVHEACARCDARDWPAAAPAPSPDPQPLSRHEIHDAMIVRWQESAAALDGEVTPARVCWEAAAVASDLLAAPAAGSPEPGDDGTQAVIDAAKAWAEVRRTRRGGAISQPIENEDDVRAITLGFAAEQRALDDLLSALDAGRAALGEDRP